MKEKSGVLSAAGSAPAFPSNVKKKKKRIGDKQSHVARCGILLYRCDVSFKNLLSAEEAISRVHCSRIICKLMQIDRVLVRDNYNSHEFPFPRLIHLGSVVSVKSRRYWKRVNGWTKVGWFHLISGYRLPLTSFDSPTGSDWPVFRVITPAGRIIIRRSFAGFCQF